MCSDLSPILITAKLHHQGKISGVGDREGEEGTLSTPSVACTSLALHQAAGLLVHFQGLLHRTGHISSSPYPTLQAACSEISEAFLDHQKETSLSAYLSTPDSSSCLTLILPFSLPLATPPSSLQTPLPQSIL